MPGGQRCRARSWRTSPRTLEFNSRVARKIDPNEIVDEFRDDLETVRNTFAVLIELTNEEPLLTELSIDTFVRAAVAFETFRSDWHIAAINRDAAVFLKSLSKSIRSTVAGARDYRGAADLVQVGIVKNPSVAVIRNIVDPLGRNVAFGDTNGWKKRADRELAPRYTARVRALTAGDLTIITAVIAIRNCIAHHSAGSVTEMNGALQRLPAGLRKPTNRVSVKGIGAYLWAAPPGQTRARTTHFIRELRRIASILKIS